MYIMLGRSTAGGSHWNGGFFWISAMPAWFWCSREMLG